MISLVLEASTYAGSAALIEGATVLGARSVAMRGRDHEALMPAVAWLLAESGIAPGAIGRVICGAGPGSFTSLRIAGSIAKGIAMASGAELVPVSSLALLVASREVQRPGLYLAAVDAMRGEQYVQFYEADAKGDLCADGSVAIVPATAVAHLAEERSAIVLGPSQHGADHAVPVASAAARITKLIASIAPAELASWEPGYGRLAEAQVKWEAEHGKPLLAP